MFKSKKLFTYVLFMVLAVSFTSCINIIEKIKINKDGSGTYSMTIDMGQVAAMIKMMAESADSEENPMDDIMGGADSTFQANKARLEALEGISNVRMETNAETLNITLKYDFESVAALNYGIWKFNSDERKRDFVDYYTMDKKTFSRIDRDVLTESLTSSLTEDNEYDINPAVIFADMTYQLEIEFERTIKKFSNDNFEKIGKNTLRFKKYVFKPGDEDKKLGLEVKLK